MNRQQPPPVGDIRKSLLKVWQLLTRPERWKLLVLTGLVCVQAAIEVVGIGAVPAFAGALTAHDKLLQHGFIGPLLRALDVHTQRDMIVTLGVGMVGAFALKTG